jgi:hypothetical protein
MCDAGVIVPDMKLEEMVRELAKLTPIDEETRDDMGAGKIPVGIEDVKSMLMTDMKPAADPLVQTAQTGAKAPANKPSVGPATKPGTNAQAAVAKPAPKPTSA